MRALQIVEAVAPNRDRMDACLVFPSMPAVMRLNKLGSFSMAQLGQSKSIIGDMMKSARKNTDNFEENLLKLVRTLPKVLKYLPSDKAQDARNFVTSLQYWTGGNSSNLQSLLLNVTKEYVPEFKVRDSSSCALPAGRVWAIAQRLLHGAVAADGAAASAWCVLRDGRHGFAGDSVTTRLLGSNATFCACRT